MNKWINVLLKIFKLQSGGRVNLRRHECRPHGGRGMAIFKYFPNRLRDMFSEKTFNHFLKLWKFRPPTPCLPLGMLLPFQRRIVFMNRYHFIFIFSMDQSHKYNLCTIKNQKGERVYTERKIVGLPVRHFSNFCHYLNMMYHWRARRQLFNIMHCCPSPRISPPPPWSNFVTLIDTSCVIYHRSVLWLL